MLILVINTIWLSPQRLHTSMFSSASSQVRKLEDFGKHACIHDIGDPGLALVTFDLNMSAIFITIHQLLTADLHSFTA